MGLLYNVALFLLALVALPSLLYQMLVHGKYVNSFSQRCGIGIPTINNDRFTVWIHAVSLGEARAGAALAKQIKQTYPDCCLVISTVTETGLKDAKKSIPFADHYLHLPFDFTFIVKRVLNKIKPDLVVLVETDFWFNFLSEAKKSGAQIALVNGKLSERSAERYKTFSFFSKRLFSNIDLFCVQSNEYKNRFLEIGIPNEKIIVTGNMKFDHDYPVISEDEKQKWMSKLGVDAKSPVLTIASTHAPEESECLTALKNVWDKYPDLKVLIAPRHPERFQEVAKLCQTKNIPFTKFSDLSHSVKPEKLILIDVMGMVKTLFQVSNVAIVAGSFGSNVGGHNILEPAAYGIPVLFGPQMHEQNELVTLCLKYQAGCQVNVDNLGKKLIDLLENPELSKSIGENGLQLMKDNKGAVMHSWEAIKKLPLKCS